MVDYKELIATLIAEATKTVSKEEILDFIEIPGDEKMGDYAFPCFRLAKAMRKAPPMIAKDICGAIQDADIFEKVEAVNGYVNMHINRAAFISNLLTEVQEKGEGYGRSQLGKGKKVIVEYSSPNIAKPFHIGHIRSTVIGNSIYKIYDFLGYDTVRINHLGDYGTQFGKMICAYRHWGNKEDVIKAPIKTLLGYYTKFHQEVENDPSLDQEARDIFTRLEQKDPEEVALWQWFRDESLKEFTRVYEMLGIEFDSYAGESFYSDKMPRMIKELDAKGLLQESRGAQIVDLDAFGLSPALVTKSDGSTLYITRDIAAAVYRKEHYDFYKNLYIVSSGQNLHFQQWIQIVEMLGYEWARDCVHIPFGLVSLEDGTMSTRAGRIVFLEDVLSRAVEQTREIIVEKNVNTDNIEETAKQVGIGAVVFQELSNNRIKDYVFSWDRVLNFEGETGPYVQYTHARAASVLRKAGAEAAAKAETTPVDASLLTGERAYQLARLIYALPEVVIEAGEKYEPSVVTRHVINIAQSFNKFYHDEHILVDDEEERTAKLALVFAAKTAIHNGLGLLGIEAPEKM
jgi:arginyl-tRNA synthetase